MDCLSVELQEFYPQPIVMNSYYCLLDVSEIMINRAGQYDNIISNIVINSSTKFLLVVTKKKMMMRSDSKVLFCNLPVMLQRSLTP